MKIKRVFVKNDPAPRVAVFSRNRWIPLPYLLSPDGRPISGELEAFISDSLAILRAGPSTWDKLQKMADAFGKKIPETEVRPLLPFKPLSWRCFMLFEEHATGAVRGYARRFKPWAHKAATVYEKITRSTFPGFRPGPFWYSNPAYYMGNHLSFVTDNDPVGFPSYSEALDYALELGAVIAHPIKNASPKEALKAVGGFVVLNNFSARDVQMTEMQSGFGPVKSNSFMSAVSAELVTADEIVPRIDQLKGDIRINGELVAETDTAGMHHGLGRAIAYASISEQIHPGEFVSTGGLPGGSGMEKGRWLSPGDTVSVRIRGIGSLASPVV